MNVKALLLAVLAGCGYFIGFVGFGVWPLTYLFMALLLLALENASPRQGLLLGWLSGTVANMGGYYWVNHLLQDFANLNVPLAFLGYFLLCVYQGGMVAVVGYGIVRGRENLGIHPAISLMVMWPFAEFIYPFIFPSYVGNSLYQQSHLTQIVGLLGMLFLTLQICVVNGAVFSLLRKGKYPAKQNLSIVAGAVLFLLGSAVYGTIKIKAFEAEKGQLRQLKTALIQTNLGARDKAKRRNEFIRRHQAMSREVLQKEPDVELIVWPESAFNRAIHRDMKNVESIITSGIDAPVAFGVITVGRNEEGRRQVFNSAVLTSSTGDILTTFDKIELLVFGETIPLIETFPQIRKWLPRSSVFDRGRNYDPFRMKDGTRLMPMICYEDIIPRFVLNMWQKGGPSEVLVNMTNDSWYGDTHEPLIHLALATFRSIETGRSLIRTTNTGISAVVDPVGRIQARTGQWTRETLVEQVTLVEDERETIYMQVGDIIGYLSFFLVFLAGVLIWKKRSR